MQYVIAHREHGYLYRTPTSRWERTDNLEKAERLDFDKAENVLNNCIAVAQRQYWQILSEEDAYLALQHVQESDTIPFGDFDWEAITCHQQLLYQDLKRYAEQLSNELKQVDQEISDIEHYIEFFTLDAARGYKAYRMLKDRLERRRAIKDERAKANCLLCGSSLDYSSGKISRQIENYDKKSYTPRILSELFNLDCRGKFTMFPITADASNSNCA